MASGIFDRVRRLVESPASGPLARYAVFVVRSAAVLAVLLSPLALPARLAAAAPTEVAPEDERTSPAEDETDLAEELEAPSLPRPRIVYLQYGVAFTAEHVASPGPICNRPEVPCILGGGGGIAVRVGWRSNGPVYLGAAYQLTKQDPNKLYRLALLQQARAEARYYLATARLTEPYVVATAGVGGYGNEWAIDTWGPTGALGVGLEYQISRRTVVGVALAYQLLHLGRFEDTAKTPRDPGIAQLVGLDFILERRDGFFTGGTERR